MFCKQPTGPKINNANNKNNVKNNYTGLSYFAGWTDKFGNNNGYSHNNHVSQGNYVNFGNHGNHRGNQSNNFNSGSHGIPHGNYYSNFNSGNHGTNHGNHSNNFNSGNHGNHQGNHGLNFGNQGYGSNGPRFNFVNTNCNYSGPNQFSANNNINYGNVPSPASAVIQAKYDELMYYAMNAETFEEFFQFISTSRYYVNRPKRPNNNIVRNKRYDYQMEFVGNSLGSLVDFLFEFHAFAIDQLEASSYIYVKDLKNKLKGSILSDASDTFPLNMPYPTFMMNILLFMQSTGIAIKEDPVREYDNLARRVGETNVKFCNRLRGAFIVAHPKWDYNNDASLQTRCINSLDLETLTKANVSSIIGKSDMSKVGSDVSDEVVSLPEVTSLPVVESKPVTIVKKRRTPNKIRKAKRKQAKKLARINFHNNNRSADSPQIVIVPEAAENLESTSSMKLGKQQPKNKSVSIDNYKSEVLFKSGWKTGDIKSKSAKKNSKLKPDNAILNDEFIKIDKTVSDKDIVLMGKLVEATNEELDEACENFICCDDIAMWENMIAQCRETELPIETANLNWEISDPSKVIRTEEANFEVTVNTENCKIDNFKNKNASKNVQTYCKYSDNLDINMFNIILNHTKDVCYYEDLSDNKYLILKESSNKLMDITISIFSILNNVHGNNTCNTYNEFSGKNSNIATLSSDYGFNVGYCKPVYSINSHVNWGNFNS
ncbi:unnamed protein product [Rotaria socialis]|uniref:Uncharacterized protein n=1 Tax=Rotaria socialis TaxID=392032 RepID=A0A818P7L1_9BILA|nr:unnamed protein product [Rotaria socialis]